VQKIRKTILKEFEKMPSTLLPGTLGADIFSFDEIADIGLVSGDRAVISSFQQGVDLIDLSGLDALTGQGGIQHFTFVGTAAHSGLGATLRYFQTAANTTLIYGDIDADGIGDFALELTGHFDLTVADFSDLSIVRLLGSNMSDVLSGSAGAEDIFGFEGNDTLSGFDGADLLFGGSGRDDLAGGGGDDTLVGGLGMDRLTGWHGRDLLQGMASNDWLAGGDDNDTVDGGTGNDTAFGNSGDDVLLGGDGFDNLDGGDGDDTIDGGNGADEMRGGLNNDLLQGRLGNDTADGGDGNDTLEGHSGSDSLIGGSGRDSLNGGADNDTLDGGDGNDTLQGWVGRDLLLGMASNDWMAGGDGNDTIDGGLGNDTAYGNDGDDMLVGGAGYDELDGGDGDDTIEGGNGGDSLRGGLNNDLIHGGDGQDTVDGGDGDDIIGGQDGADLLQGGKGRDYLQGGDQNDTLDGGDGADTLYGWTGRDVIFGMESADWIAGGAGDDTINAGLGNDTAYGNLGNDLILGGPGHDFLDGGDGNDTIDGGNGADSIRGGLGRDNLRGGLGNDTIDGGNSNDTIDGGSAADSVSGGLGADSILGGLGNDTLVGGDQNDTLAGGAGANLVFGDDGNDTIRVTGDDTVFGGTGTDTAQLTLTFGQYLFGTTAAPGGVTVFNSNIDGEFHDVEKVTFSDGFVLDLEAADNPAYASEDYLITNENTPIVFSSSLLLQNDRDFEGDAFSIASVDATGALGTVNVVTGAGGAVSSIGYTPGPTFNSLQVGENLIDRFTYTLTDTTGIATTATVNVIVSGVNDDPEMRLGVFFPSYSPLIPGQAFPAGGPSNVFTDPEDDPLTYTATGLPAGLSVDPVTGLIIGTVNAAAAPGAYSATITAADPFGGQAFYTQNLTVADTAASAVDDVFAMTANTVLTANVALNDDLYQAPLGGTDPNYVFSHPTDFSVPGTVYGDLDLNPDGTFTYTPQNGIYGTDRFSYQVTGPDGTSSIGFVDINIANIGSNEIAANANGGLLPLVSVSRAADGEVASLEYQLDLSVLTAGSTGDSADITELLELFFSNTPGSIGGSDDPVTLYHPTAPLAPLAGTSAQIQGDVILLSISPDILTGPQDFGLRFGYNNFVQVDAVISSDAIDFPLNFLPTFTPSLASVEFSTNTSVIDDRVTGPVVGGALFNGAGGTDGILKVTTPLIANLELEIAEGSALDVVSEFFAPVIVEFLTVLAEALGESAINMYNSYGQSFIEYERIDGVDGPDGNVVMNTGVYGTTVGDVIIGRNALSAADGGDGGDATKGGDGFVAALNPLTYVPILDNFAGANGGNGGAGGTSYYFIDALDGDDFIVGGSGGSGGDGGKHGATGIEGADAVDSLLGSVTADGGSGGIGGLGGEGGFAEYRISGGGGTDTIFGGNGGNGGDGGKASALNADGGDATYFIDGGLQDDVIHGGAAGRGSSFVGGGDAIYRIKGGQGMDTIHVGALLSLNGQGQYGPSIFNATGGYSVDWEAQRISVQEDTNDFVVGFGANVRVLLPGERLGTSTYEVFGGTEDDTFLFDGTLGRAHYTDGGTGIDTMRIAAPGTDPATAWELDFNAASVARSDGVILDAQQDMIDNVESFIFDGTARRIEVNLSGQSARAMADGSDIAVLTPGNPTSTSPAIYLKGEGSTGLDLIDDTDWSSTPTSTFDGVAYDGFYNATHDVHVFVADMDFLF
jgi:Ca2+-binding RTX toxin-like protein